MFNLQGKVALVTGAGSGIGAAIAETLALAGAHIWVTDRTATGGGHETVERILSAGGRAQLLKLDVTSEADAAAAVRSVAGPLDVLVNNAGIGCVGTILKTSMEDFNRLLDVNVRGMFRVTQAFLPAMLERKRGSVVNLGSIAGVVAVRDRFAYTMTKFAVVGMTKALALDHSASGVRFNAVCPCRVETPWIARRIAESSDAEAARRDMEGTQLAGRMAKPQEIAAAALYLAADESAMVTGTTLMIDSGWSAGK